MEEKICLLIGCGLPVIVSMTYGSIDGNHSKKCQQKLTFFRVQLWVQKVARLWCSRAFICTHHRWWWWLAISRNLIASLKTHFGCKIGSVCMFLKKNHVFHANKKKTNVTLFRFVLFSAYKLLIHCVRVLKLLFYLFFFTESLLHSFHRDYKFSTK